MVRKSPRKKPPKRLDEDVPAKMKKELVDKSPKKTNKQTNNGPTAPNEILNLPLKLKLSLQELTSKSSKKKGGKKKAIKQEEQEAADIPSYVPPHMLGRNLTDPLSDQVEGSNRGLQKPRYGVKVPNRNLTSPILSHTELNRELLARSRLRRPVVYEDIAQCGAAGSYLFSLKMVSRLAGSMPSRSYPLKLNPDTLKLTLNTNSQLMPKLDAKTEKELALKQLNEMRSH